MTRSPGDELIDVVDTDDRVVATVNRARMRAERLRHRAVFILIRNSVDDVLVHRRSEAKDLWPGRWDLMAGGVVSAGERYADAARRELAEELGVDAEPVEIGPAAYADADVDLIARVFEVRHDGPFHFTDGEVVEARFVTLAELRLMIETLPFVPDSVSLVADFL